VKAIKASLAALLLSGLLAGGASETTGASPTMRTNSDGGVTVKVTRLDSKASDVLRFQIVLDTHSVNLDSYDLKTITFVRDGSGNLYRPASVEVKGNGHHRQATVSFSNVKKSPQAIELVIKSMAGIDERVFRWNME